MHIWCIFKNEKVKFEKTGCQVFKFSKLDHCQICVKLHGRRRLALLSAPRSQPPHESTSVSLKP